MDEDTINFTMTFIRDMDEDINELDLTCVRDILRHKIGLFIAALGLPFTAVDNDYFTDLLETALRIDPQKMHRLNPPCRQTISKRILPNIYEHIEVLKKQLLQNYESCMLCDSWKNKSSNKKLMVCTLHTVRVHQLFLTSFDISLEVEDTESLAAILSNAAKLAYEKYETTVVSIETDNDSKIKAGGRNAVNHKGEKLIVATCSNHSGNRLVISVTDENFATTVRDFVKEFKDPRLATLIRLFGGTQLQNLPDTRFGFFRSTCESVYKNLDNGVLKKVFCVQDVILKQKTIELLDSEAFKAELAINIQNLTPICELINKCQSPECDIADAVHFWLTLTLPTPEFDDIVASRIDSAISDAGYAAYLIHPKYRGARLNLDQRKKAVDFLEGQLDAEGKAQLTEYIENLRESDSLAENCKKPISYWSRKYFLQPELSRLCIRLLTIPASTASIESYFSLWTYVHNDYRNRMSDETSSLVVDLYYMSKHFKKGEWLNTTVKKRKRNVEINEDYQ